MLNRLLDHYFRYPIKGLDRVKGAYYMSHEVVVKFAFDPQTKQLVFAKNHDIAASLLKRAAVARKEMVTATIMITGKPGVRSFELLDYSVFSSGTKVTPELKDEITQRIGRLIAHGGFLLSMS